MAQAEAASAGRWCREVMRRESRKREALQEKTWAVGAQGGGGGRVRQARGDADASSPGAGGMGRDAGASEGARTRIWELSGDSQVSSAAEGPGGVRGSDSKVVCSSGSRWVRLRQQCLPGKGSRDA